ncbi:MAG: transcriptional coactivator p15/PC4 family protein [bacterium]
MAEEWIEKNKTEKIKISRYEFKEKELLDIRIFYYDKNDEEYKPSKKGVSIPFDKSDELIEVLNYIIREED